MTRKQIYILVGGAAALYLISQRSTAGGVQVVPQTGPLYFPGQSPIAPGAPTPILPIASGPGGNEIPGTGLTAAELGALGYTPAQITELSLSGDPAISSILDFTPPMPILSPGYTGGGGAF